MTARTTRAPITETYPVDAAYVVGAAVVRVLGHIETHRPDRPTRLRIRVGHRCLAPGGQVWLVSWWVPPTALTVPIASPSDEPIRLSREDEHQLRVREAAGELRIEVVE